MYKTRVNSQWKLMCLAKPLCVKSEWLSIQVDYEITLSETNIIDKNNISTCSWNKAGYGDKASHQTFEELHAETQWKSQTRSGPLGIIKAYVLHLDIKGLMETSDSNVMHVWNNSHQLHKSHLSLSAQPRPINIVFKTEGSGFRVGVFFPPKPQCEIRAMYMSVSVGQGECLLWLRPWNTAHLCSFSSAGSFCPPVNCWSLAQSLTWERASGWGRMLSIHIPHPTLLHLINQNKTRREK